MARLGRQDGWQNTLTGLGLAGDSTKYNRYGSPCWRSPAELTDIYRYNWLARKLVEALPFRALARGVDEATPLPERFDELNFARWDEGALMRAITLGRLYGGTHLFLGHEGGGEDLLLPPAPGARVAFLDVFTRHELTPAVLSTGEARDRDPLSPTVGDVTHWQVTGDHPRSGMIYHRDRAIAFGGNSLPPSALMRTSSTTRGEVSSRFERDWSDSVLLKCWDDIQRYGTFWQSISYLIQVSSIGVLKISGLIEMLAQESQETIKARIDVLNRSLSVTRNLMLDAGQNGSNSEDYDRKAVSFADVPALLDQLMQATSGAFDMPATELFGRAPQGMNATGESDAAMWEARVEEWRRRVLRPRMNRLCSAIAGTPMKIEYPEVHISSDQERADLRLKLLQGDERLWTMSVISPDEIRKARHTGQDPEQIATGAAPEPEPVVVEDPNAPPEGDGNRPPTAPVQP